MGSRLNQQFEAEVTRIADDGSGVMEPSSKPIFVANTIPGEIVTATTVCRVRDGIQAKLDRVVKPSPHRITPMCPYAGACGGCKWQHMEYPHQLALKLSLIRQTFAEQELACPVETIEPCPEPFYYRNRMDYVFGSDGSLGLKEPGRWWSVLDLSTCFLLSKEGVEILRRVREWSRRSELPFWHARTHEGFLRYLVIREGKHTGERLVMLVTHRPSNEMAGSRMRELPDLLKGLATSIVWGINPRITDLSMADELVSLFGDPWLEEVVNGLRYRIHPNSFFQTNTIMAAMLQQYVKDLCEPLKEKNILDLYCGGGFFTLALSGARQLTGIELDPLAIENAKLNARRNGIQATFLATKAEEYDWIKTCPQVVIVDPPRSGLHPNVIKTLRSVLPAQLIYVSCNHRRLVSELPFFLDRYRVKEAKAFDLFPHTPHVEVVVSLQRV